MVKLSIIIATHERPDSLNRLLDSLKPQLNSQRHELFVAENGTPAPMPMEVPLPGKHLHDTRPGKCRIQNRALAGARGELIAFLDDDLAVSPRYVQAVEKFFDSHPEYAAMKGRILPIDDPAKVGQLAPYLDLPLVDHGDQVIEVRGVLGANMAFRAEALHRVGPFDERLGPGASGHEEETEMSQRLRRHGYRIGYAPDAIVYHEVDSSRASRERYIRIARERGYCRTLHERHSRLDVAIAILVASTRLLCAKTMGASTARIAREERRLAIAQGIMHGLRGGASRSIARQTATTR